LKESEEQRQQEQLLFRLQEQALREMDN